MNVDKSTFPFVFEDFTNSLEGCDFYAVDQEMTGVDFEGSCRSWAMSLSELYGKNRDVVKRYVAFQFGIAIFTRVSECVYEVKPYNFYLLKRSGDFTASVSAVEFLVSHRMNFQQWLETGLDYCNKEEEDHDRNIKKMSTVYSDLEKKIANCIVDDIEKWYTSYSENSTETKKLNTVMTQGIEAIVYSILMDRKIYVRLEYESKSELYQHSVNVTVQPIDCDTFNIEYQKKKSKYISPPLAETVGFRRLWKCLTKCKKPLIGHNFCLDLMFMIQMHESSVPVAYEDFKKLISELFPSVYDTKTLSRSIHFSTTKTPSNLQELYRECCKLNDESEIPISFKSPPGFHFYDRKYTGSKGKAHEAGYDAYMTGIVFAVVKEVYGNKDGFQIDKWENVISVYGNHYYMNLHGSDFLRSKSTFLLEFEEDIDVRLLNSLLCSKADIKQFEKNSRNTSFFVNAVFPRHERCGKIFVVQFSDPDTDEESIRTQIDSSREELSESLCSIMNSKASVFPGVTKIYRFPE